MREIETHKVAGAAGEGSVFAEDAAGPGGANHTYRLTQGAEVWGPTVLRFQQGPIGEVGANGITNEALLAVVIDRLEGFQRGPFACEANGYALNFCQNALFVLQERTRQRVARGVEGKLQA